MRLRNLIIGDIKFQFKYGFYLIYVIMTVLYVCLLHAIPLLWRSKAGLIMIYSDPAAVGLFFMGAIILLEKSQRVLNSIAVSPVKVSEYILSKVISLSVIGTVVGAVIAYSIGIRNIGTVILGTLIGSAIFSMLGLIVAAKINTLNQFIIATIPLEIICFVPPMLYLFGYRKNFMLLHPGCIIMRLFEGEKEFMLGLMVLLIAWVLLIYCFTYRIMKKMFLCVGGVKL